MSDHIDENQEQEQDRDLARTAEELESAGELRRARLRHLAAVAVIVVVVFISTHNLT
jgi:hypothetical protein